jgi:hypothetical protein
VLQDVALERPEFGRSAAAGPRQVDRNVQRHSAVFEQHDPIG